jgi:hypothetical protein
MTTESIISKVWSGTGSFAKQQEIVRLLDGQFDVIERNEREINGAMRKSEALP